jgi:hypothetical protein
MTKFQLLGATALVLASALGGPAMAQEVIYNPGYCAQFYPNANCQNKGPGNPYTGDYQRRTVYHNSYNRSVEDANWNDDRRYRRDSGFWPGDVAAGVVGGAIGTAGAIATAPFRGNEPYAYGGSYASYDQPYYGHRSGKAACGVQPGETYLGRDGQWYPC